MEEAEVGRGVQLGGPQVAQDILVLDHWLGSVCGSLWAPPWSLLLLRGRRVPGAVSAH